jgi:Cu-Zn family superoxide dismutase
MTRLLAFPLAVSALALVAGCAAQAPAGPAALAQLKPTQGHTATGTVRFTQTGNTVRVAGELRGLKPNAEHGFHVHEKGDCSAPDGMSTGGHFNPAGQPPGEHGHMPAHAGDLRPVKADATGNATFSYESTAISVGSGANDVIGKGLIVHRDPDDYNTQPTGNAGPRIACAVISRN